jgi:NADPH-dependent 2,4-dienoyl-CoA reductase/sulfur reductase-like enzyme
VRQTKYLLIGGGLASIRAARQIRASDPDGRLVIACEEAVPPYDRPPLSKEYLRGDKTRDALFLETTDWLAEHHVEVSLGTPVTSLDVRDHAASVGGEHITFERALIATGGRPIRLRVPGADLQGIHYLRTATDADGIRHDAARGGKAVVVGGGFIGIEVAATLRQRGVEVTVIEALPRIWARFGNEALSAYVARYCGERGVRFMTDTTVAEFRGDSSSGRLVSVETAAGDSIACEMACIGVGIAPNVGLAAEAGLTVDNGIVVDEQLQTSEQCIYAAGDVINYLDPIFQKRRRVEHWGHAEYSGQIAGANMAGGTRAYEFLSYVWSDIFDLRLEFAGDESDHDLAVTRGDPSRDTFVIIYLKADRAVAFFAVNTPPREFAVIRRLIQTRRDLAGREGQLGDPSFNLRGLL